MAVREYAAGNTPNLASLLPASGWELRHTSGSFTFAAHQAFFAGLPTRPTPEPQPRLFAAEFEGSETIGEQTFCFGSRTWCRRSSWGGTARSASVGSASSTCATRSEGCCRGCSTKRIGRPSWASPTSSSTEHQVALACARLAAVPVGQRVFTFLNVSAIHQPNRVYLPGATHDSLETHAAALRYVDSALPPLIEAQRRRGPAFCIICSDHGTLYGEDGFSGHRLAHPNVWQVPYAELLL